ncbi:MAG TPA: hypothetical protein DCY79_22545 [Planctomycetaceae bacterium]|nr:hypothetical protein [Blastopirellula sp.]HAY82597.1 hypothetical protein [Planctomycetaceae bacterium]
MSRPFRWFSVYLTLTFGLALGLLAPVDLASLVSAVERVDYHAIRRPIRATTSDGKYEGETHFERHGHARIQGMAGYGRDWSGDAHFLWDGAIGDQAKVGFRVPRASHFQLTLQLTRAVDYGVFRIYLDGQPIGNEVDLFSTKVELAPVVDLGKVSLAEGRHQLVFELVRGNPRAKKFRDKGFLLGLDYFKLIDLAPPPKVTEEPVATPVLTQPVDFSVAKSLLMKYCWKCHNAEKSNGDVLLSNLQTESAFVKQIAVTEKVADAIVFGTMPPEDAQQPTAKERTQLARFFSTVIDQYAAKSENVAPVVMRRLNRYEYNNAVRDLLNLKGDIYPLPERTLRGGKNYFRPESGLLPDVVQVGNRTLGKNQVERQILDGVSPFAIDLQAEHGFNNRGEQLSISPILLEAFVELGNSIVNSPQFANYCRDYEAVFRGSDPPQRQRDIELAKVRIAALLERAFRQPLDGTTHQRYAAYFEREYQRTKSFADSMKRVVAAMIASPRFLYLVERRGTEGTAKLTDYELATRLAFFLWSTLPDEELLTLAKKKQLHQPEVLAEQVNRMLLSPKSQALSENFARQWLRLDQLITAVPDFERFPAYYSRIGCEQWKFGLQTMVEPLLLFESILVEDRSIMLLIDSNYSYRSDELESWYKDKNPFGGRGNINRFNTNQQNFVRRELATRREGGVITSAAVLTMTSSPLRTSPITRGAWVATVILNQPPAPPPDVVPEIEADDKAIEAQGITLRQRLKQHQTNESCAACHAKIDPLGFVLENYDAVGRWRDTYRSGLAIDASGKLFGDVAFTDIESFKDVLLDRPNIFIRAFSEHLLSYALGRELGPADKPAVDRIVRRGQAADGQLSTIVREIVHSRPFRHKSNQSSTASRKEDAR